MQAAMADHEQSRIVHGRLSSVQSILRFKVEEDATEKLLALATFSETL